MFKNYGDIASLIRKPKWPFYDNKPLESPKNKSNQKNSEKKRVIKLF